MTRRIILLIVLAGVLAESAEARQRAQGYCSQGGQAITVAGLAATQSVQGSFPGCTVQVYLAGTLTPPGNIYADNAGTIKSNPFTADLVTGAWSFYADNGRYDVQMSGAGLPSNFVYADIQLLDPAEILRFGANSGIWTDVRQYGAAGD